MGVSGIAVATRGTGGSYMVFVGIGGLVAVLALCVVLCCRHFREKRRREAEQRAVRQQAWTASMVAAEAAAAAPIALPARGHTAVYAPPPASHAVPAVAAVVAVEAAGASPPASPVSAPGAAGRGRAGRRAAASIVRAPPGMPLPAGDGGDDAVPTL